MKKKGQEYTKKQVTKGTSQKLRPSELQAMQLAGTLHLDLYQKPKIKQFNNITDYSTYAESRVPVDEPLFESVPPVIQFSDFEPLQIKEKVFKLRNKDNVARRVKIVQPDSRLFSVHPVGSNYLKGDNSKGNKVAPGIEIQYIIRFSPEAKIDYSYELNVVTERELFVIPIIAIGKRAMLEFPDILDFGDCPVKYKTEKPVIIRNIGEKTCKWLLELPQGWTCNKKEGVLEQHKNEQIIVYFYPNEARMYKLEALLHYDNLEAYVVMQGRAYNGNVYLSKSNISMDDAYIGLTSQQSLQIVNKSAVKVEFQWRAFKTEKEEQEKKNRLRQQLEQEEAEERMLLKEIVSNEVVREEIDIDDQDDSDDEEKDEKFLLLKKQKKAELMLARKYKNVWKAIDDDMLLFQDDIFKVEPQMGEIWPNSELTITITFYPKGALNYQCTVFCNISCSDSRLPLHLTGEGIGPKATIYPPFANIGDVFIQEERTHDFMIENQGEIEAKFELVPNETPFGRMFHFSVERGVLDVGGRMPFQVTFCSAILGEFSEKFRWKLEGSTELHHIDFTGHVMSPSFKFDKEELNFGKVSYSFPNTRKVRLFNTSTVPFKYNLRIPGDGRLSNNQKEFTIVPQSDILPKGSSVEIEVTFVSRVPKKYDMVMVIDIVGVGSDMYSLPIKAESEVPTVRIEPEHELLFEDVFLRNPCQNCITLINESNLKARFRVLPQREETKVLAEYSVDIEDGEIDKQGRVTLTITLITHKLKQINMKLEINIEGNTTGNPYTIMMKADSKGPQVRMSEKDINFGVVEVLQERKKKVTIYNDGKIDADYYAFTRNKISVFKAIQKEGILKPNESRDVDIVCYADDNIQFRDTLYFIIKEGVDQEVGLRCQGEGSTIYPMKQLENINFEIMYTQRIITKEIFVENKGRRDQNLHWNRKAIAKPKPEKGEKDKEDKKKDDEEHFNFVVVPERKEIPSKHGFMFQFKAFGIQPGKFTETFMLNTQYGNDRKSNPIGTCQIKGTFIEPTIAFNVPRLYFKYSWERNVPISALSKTLDLTCTSELPTNFTMRTQTPFSINIEKLQMTTKQVVQMKVDFDPSLKIDKVSDKITGRLQLQHLDHTHKQQIDLIGEVCFPNVKLSSDSIDFGAILGETSKKMSISITNISEMTVDYYWTFVQDEENQEYSNQIDINLESHNNNSNIPINEIFDILPLSGKLEPNETTPIEFIFNAIGKKRYYATAICHVEGGPDYQVQLLGDASLIKYKITPNVIDLGEEVKFGDTVQRDFWIYNQDDHGVTFSYTISLSTIIRKGLVDVGPTLTGKIPGGGREKFYVKICPGMPAKIQEKIMVQIAYFEPEAIQIKGNAYYPSITTNLFRIDCQQYLQLFEQEKKKKSDDEKKLLTVYMSQMQNMSTRGNTEESGFSFKGFPQNQQIVVENLMVDIDTEVDRKILCDIMMKNINEFAQNQLNAELNFNTSKGLSESALMSRAEAKSYQSVVLANYTIDFGNIVVGQTKKKTFKIFNTSTRPIDIIFDQHHSKQSGYSLSQERILKFLPHGNQIITITLTTKKNQQLGKNRVLLPVEVKSGTKYSIELLVNVTIPEICLDQECLDFSRVLINQRKTMFIRFYNKKEVQCEWQLNQRQELGQQQNDAQRFGLFPQSGVIPSGGNEIVKVQFAPVAEKQYNYKFSLIIKENPKLFNIQVKGIGTTVCLELCPQPIMNIGPVLPYDNAAYGILQVKNISDFDTEIYSIEYDNEYLKEEEQLTKYNEFVNNDQLFFDVRKPGEQFWSDIMKSNARKDQYETIEKQIKDIIGDDEESINQKESLQKKLEQLQLDDRIIEYPKVVEPDVLLHIIVFGQPGCGKTQMMQHLQEKQKRAIVNMNELLEWNNMAGTEASKKAAEHFEKRKQEMEAQIAEREKIIKKAGKKGKQVEEQLGPINEEQYNYLTEEILQELLVERLKHAECNAGVMFDNLQSKYYPDELIALKVIIQVVGRTNLQLCVFEEPVDDSQLPICQWIEWDLLEQQFKETAVLNVIPPIKKPKELQSKEQQQQKGQQKEQPKDQQKEQQQTPQQDKKQLTQGKGKKEGKIGKKDDKKQGKTSKEKQQQQPQEKQHIFKMDNEELEYYEVYLPKQFSDPLEKEKFNQLKEEIKKFFVGDIADIRGTRFEIPEPVKVTLEEFSKKKPAPLVLTGDKKKDVHIQELINQQQEEERQINEGKLNKVREILENGGSRQLTLIPLHYNLSQLNRNALAKFIPAPIYPDPNLLPPPDPIFHQILSIPNERKKREPSNYFSILTPIQEMLYKNSYYEYKKKLIVEEKLKAEQQAKAEEMAKEEAAKEAEGKGGKKQGKQGKQGKKQSKEEAKKEKEQQQQQQQQQEEKLKSQQEIEVEEESKRLQDGSMQSMSIEEKQQLQESQQEVSKEEEPIIFSTEQLLPNRTRWILPSKQTLLLIVKFFTTEVNNYETKLNFEAFYSTRSYSVTVNGLSDFPQISQLPKSLFTKHYRTRAIDPPQCYISKAYIQSEKVYDFGPLLIGKSVQNMQEPLVKQVNSSIFNITNQGRFDCCLEFSLMSSVIEKDLEYKKGVFHIEPERMVINCNNALELQKEIRVWALPDEPRKFKDQLIIMIKDNPQPVLLPLKCLGQRPICEIIEGENILFERILLGQNQKKIIKLKNTCAIPLKWKLEGIEELPAEFTVINTSGDLKPTQETIIEIGFKAMKQMKFSQKLSLEVTDFENQGIKQESQPINIEAEAFDITVEFKFPSEGQSENRLNFGAIKVGELKEQTFMIKNIGLYKVKLAFVMKKKQFRECFYIEPQQYELESGQEKMISIRFLTKIEMKLHTTNNTTDINLEILEGKTLETYKTVPINISLNAVFSKYSIHPLKSINFGPMQFNETKTRQFEIKNEGIFDFTYQIFDYFNEEVRTEIRNSRQKTIQDMLQQSAAAAQAQEAQKKDGKKEKKKEPSKKEAKKDNKKGGGAPGSTNPRANDPNSLHISQWTIYPYTSVIQPQQSILIEVFFEGCHQKIFEQKLGIDISGRDPDDQPDGVIYEIIAESCVPGINCENFEQIFEEQIVVQSLSTSATIAPMINSTVFAIEEKTFFFGTLVPSKVPDGIIEKFKISNPNKIACNVKLDVRKRSPTQAEQFAFELQPKTLRILPHEHQYVKVAFKPTIMATFAAVFEAIVENGESQPRTHKLVFDLRGEGAIPTLRIDRPREWLDERTLCLKFQKTRVGKKAQLPLVLKNEGVVVGTAKFDVVGHTEFKFLGQMSYSMAPKSYQQFMVEFHPQEQGQKQWNIGLQTLLNPYENSTIRVLGEAFYDDVTFEGLPEDSEDSVNFGDCVNNQEKRITFFIKNNSEQLIRFQWNLQGMEEFNVVPRCGHLDTQTTKPIILTFKSPRSTILKDTTILCMTKVIQQLSTNFIDWDDSKTQIRYISQSQYDWVMKRKEEEILRRKEEELQQSKKGGKKPQGQEKKTGKKGNEQEQSDVMPAMEQGEEANIPIEDQLPEPKFKEIEKSEKNIPLKCLAVCDYVAYECEINEIYFKPTLMYTIRTFQFKVKNTSKINSKFVARFLPNNGYFSVNPKQGILNSNCDELFTIKFSPTEVDFSNQRMLQIAFENLDPQQKPLEIEVDGEAERPVCHFEVPPTFFREKKKPDLDTKYEIIEFDSLGTKVKNTKRFYIVNPTNQGYEFEWKKIDDDKVPTGANIQYQGFFKCMTSKGVILSGKKFEMIFEYSPDIDGIHESYWMFEIASQNVQQPFLVVGSVRDPNIFIDVGKVNFGPLLIGGKNKEIVTLKNLEDVPIPFNFLKDSIKGDLEYSDSLRVTPMSGVVRENSEQQIEILFQPKVELSYNYNLSCSVKRKYRPINLNVKGIGYILHHSVFNMDVSQVVGIDPSEQHLVDFGNIFINEKKIKVIRIQNHGDFNFDYSLKKSPNINFLTMNPESSTVRKKEYIDIQLLFAPIQEYRFNRNKSNKITLQIVSGPQYTFIIAGSARKPNVELSFLEYNFGPCFVLRQPLQQVVHLQMKNRDNAAMSIETSFERQPELDFQLANGQVLLPLQQDPTNPRNEINILDIPVVFTPRDYIKYSETVTLDINNLHKIDVKFYGEGVQFKLELEKTEDQYVDFGVCRIGMDLTKIVKIFNNSRKAISISFDCPNQQEQLENLFLGLTPFKELILPPREYRELEIRFNPKQLIHHFKKEIFYKIIENSEQRKLLNISGACHGIELKVMEDTLGFGPVVINSKYTKTMQVCNLGDVMARYQWQDQFCRPFFTIMPHSGVIAPHEDIFFEITFHPNVLDNDIRFKKVKCEIEDAEPIFINLLGKCVPQPKEQIQEIKFDTIVRTATKQKVQVKNPTASPWRTKAQITTNFDNLKGYFSGKETLEIPANQTAEYEIVYYPLTMTKNDQVPEIKVEQHEGQLFFPLPDGSALLYNLIGKSQPPQPISTEDVTIAAKTNKQQILNVKNWIKSTQRFKVSYICEPEEPSIFLSGANTIDIPGEGVKAYKLSIMGLKSASQKVSVYFKNIDNSEFLYYKLNVSIQASDVLGRIELTSVVRETSSKLITIENPLKIPVSIKKEYFSTDNDCITFIPNEFQIPENQEFGFEVNYRPLLTGEQNSKFVLKSPELGDFNYQLHLIGLPSTTQRSLTFKTTLGSDLVQAFKFINYVKKQTAYQCRIEKLGVGQKLPQVVSKDAKDNKEKPPQTDFFIDNPTLNAPACDSYEGNEVSLNIRFEPSSLIDTRAVLTVISNEGGEYNCQLVGQCLPPQPKGPFKISGAKAATIDFKNTFFDAQEFIVRIDNPSFTTGTKSPVKIEAKKIININVAYKAVPGTSNNGRLMLQTGDYPPWIFYLQGE